MNPKSLQTLKLRLGQETLSLINNNNFLPLFRKWQKLEPKLFAQSVKMVKNMHKNRQIRDKQKYFAAIWSNKNAEKTLKIVKEFLNRQVSKLAEKREQKRKNAEIQRFERDFNRAGYAQFQQMKKRFVEIQ